MCALFEKNTLLFGGSFGLIIVFLVHVLWIHWTINQWSLDNKVSVFCEYILHIEINLQIIWIHWSINTNL